MMRSHKSPKKGKKDSRRLAWEDWQRYVHRETQRIMKQTEHQVVEVALSSPETKPFQPETAVLDPDHYEPERPLGRRPPVPGVSREEALQVNDDEIGRTVRPFTVRDYRDIKPLSSPDFTGPVSQPEIHTLPEPEPAPAVAPVEPVEAEVAEPVVPVVVEPVPVTEPEPAQGKPAPKKRGRRKKTEESELELFGREVSEHRVSGRRRIARKSRLEREELIEKLLDPVISLEEAATLIGVCKTTVRRYTNKDQLECLRTPGHQRRFKLSHVLEFVKKREEEEKARRSKAGKKK